MILRLLKSSAFQLTILYIGMFGVSVAVLVLFSYLLVIREMENQIKHSVNIQLADLGRKFVLYGTGETISAIENLVSKDKGDTYIYMLIDPEWKVIAGNLEKWPGGSTKTPDWIRFEYLKKGSDNLVNAIAVNTNLPDGYILLVGSTLDRVDRISEAMMNWLSIIIAITIIMALTGGLIIAHNINRRIEVINQVCRKVMTGDLEKRVKVTGSGDSFDKLAENFNQMMTRICDLIDGIKNISANVAHDLRTPLNRLRHRLENINGAKNSSDQIKAAISEIDQLVATFNAILRISQAETGAGKEQFNYFNLSAVMQDVIDLYSALAEEKNIIFQSDIENNIIFHGDKHLLAQSVANLIDNALKYTPQGGKVSVSLQKNEDNIFIIVADNGPGIPEEFHEKVKEKFFRLEKSRTTPGSGLGLSMVDAAVKLHNGRITFSDNNPGLKVVLEL